MGAHDGLPHGRRRGSWDSCATGRTVHVEPYLVPSEYPGIYRYYGSLATVVPGYGGKSPDGADLGRAILRTLESGINQNQHDNRATF